MLLYGDAERLEDPRAKLAAVRARLAAAGQGEGLARHVVLVAALIEAGELAQGLADAEFDARGCDARSPRQDAAMGLCLKLARAVRASWTSAFAARPELPLGEAADLEPRLDGEAIRTRLAEGYAFYALYPEAYLEAALGLGRAPDAVIVGIRSIGAGLAAMVAAGLEAGAAVTVRPVGHPFRRRLRLAPALGAELGRPASLYAVVDEGPGLSGSSFGAAVDALQEAGAPPSRIRLFPSHRGPPGPRADPDLLRRWPSLQRRVIEADELILRSADPQRRLERWAAALVGEPEAPLQDLSAGAWRGRLYADEAAWPAVLAGQERRKFLMRTAAGPWLLKFAGLGAEGERKLERARALHGAGFGPQTAGLAHGFLVQRWIEDAKPLDLARGRPPGLLRRLGDYLGFLARRFPASGGGASPGRLLEMARVNAEEVLGPWAAGRLRSWEGRLAALEPSPRPVDIDGRLHAWEWLAGPGGRLVKTDALDHHCAHDLVGRQDIGWDVAGAAVELGLSDEEAAALSVQAGAAAGRPLDGEALAFLRLAYLAFQLGRCVEGARASEGRPSEAERLERAGKAYAAQLRERL